MKARASWPERIARRLHTRTAVAILAGLAAAAAASWVWSNLPISVDVAVVEENVPIRVFGLGTVEARVTSKVGFEVGATLVELNADHGDRVAQGHVLARLSSGEQEAKVTKARAAQTVAEANIRRAEANLVEAQAVLAQR